MKYTVTPCDFDYNTNKQIIEDLIKEYPFLNVQLAGRTSLGRGIFSLSVGNNKNTGIYVGCVSGDDGLSALLLLLFTERLCHAVKYGHTLASVDVRKVLSFSGVTVIPCLNPDGREISVHGPKSAGSMESYVSSFYDNKTPWTANAMGVDINTNFNSRHSAPAQLFSKGDYPESEAETKTLTRLCRMKGFRRCMEIYSGEDELFYKSTEEEPAGSSMEAKILSCCSSLAVRAEKIHRHSGIMDWFIKEFHRPAFAAGVQGDSEKLYSAYEKIEEALTVFALM